MSTLLTSSGATAMAALQQAQAMERFVKAVRVSDYLIGVLKAMVRTLQDSRAFRAVLLAPSDARADLRPVLPLRPMPHSVLPCRPCLYGWKPIKRSISPSYSLNSLLYIL